jgi:hypothetical protein
VRKNHVDYPATQDKPAFSHDDLMILYHGWDNSARADYYDNEGHVIHYTASFSAQKDSLYLLSDIQSSAPRFRFTYVKTKDGSIKTLFDIATPGHPDEFHKYVEGVIKRK